MGGRGASSGRSIKGNKYGSQHHTRLIVGDIKFVEKNTRQSEPLMETMTKGRIYVEVGGDDLLRVIFFDKDNKRNRVIERNKNTDTWHVHDGYFHNEYGKEDHGKITDSDKELLDRIIEAWENKK